MSYGWPYPVFTLQLLAHEGWSVSRHFKSSWGTSGSDRGLPAMELHQLQHYGGCSTVKTGCYPLHHSDETGHTMPDGDAIGAPLGAHRA